MPSCSSRLVSCSQKLLSNKWHSRQWLEEESVKTYVLSLALTALSYCCFLLLCQFAFRVTIRQKEPAQSQDSALTTSWRLLAIKGTYKSSFSLLSLFYSFHFTLSLTHSLMSLKEESRHFTERCSRTRDKFTRVHLLLYERSFVSPAWFLVAQHRPVVQAKASEHWSCRLKMFYSLGVNEFNR